MQVVGAAKDAARIPGIDIGLNEGDTFSLGSHVARVLEIPAHTSQHIAFWFEADRAVFTGDTLFAMGCGRLFEGTPDMMWSSLSKLMRLPDDTRVYCGHEYTEANGRFALTVEPDNADLQTRMEEVREMRAEGPSDDPLDHGAREEDQSVPARAVRGDPSHARSGRRDECRRVRRNPPPQGQVLDLLATLPRRLRRCCSPRARCL